MATVQQIDQEQELKERLFQQIETIHDLSILRGVLSLLNEIAPKEIYVLTPEERTSIQEGIESLDAGNGIPHEIVKKEIREWLLNHPKNSQ